MIIDDSPSGQYADRAYSEIKQMAINYTLKPTEQIKIEELAHKLNMSVTPVREALNRLLNEDLVVRRGSRGFCNRPIDLSELHDLFELRDILVIGAIRSLLKRKSREELGQIAVKWQSLPPGDEGNTVSAEEPKHRLVDELVLLAGNHEMERVYYRIKDRINFVWSMYLATPLGRARLYEYEKKLGAAILTRDVREYVRVIEEGTVNQTDALKEAARDGLAAIYVAEDRSTAA